MLHLCGNSWRSNMTRKLPFLLVSFGLLSGCASVIEGRAQEFTVETNPAGATCTLTRAGTVLGTVSPTPGSVYIDKTKDDISVHCTKSGFADANYVALSAYPKDQWAYILVGGPVGWGVDSATGADNYYVTPVKLDLSKK
jgi:hypothetical protein